MKEYSAEELQNILSQFSVKGTIEAIKPFGSGHINSTFLVTDTDPQAPFYLLQKINHNVFKDVEGLTNNIKHVTAHLKAKVAEQGGDPDAEVLTLIAANKGGYYIKDADGNYWRMYYFMKGTKSYDMVETEKQASETGKAFGRFQKMLSDLPTSLLVETIPGFQDVELRLNQLQEAIANNAVGRLNKVQHVVDYLLDRADRMTTILKMGREGKLPKRIIHYDTKLNNVLLNDKDEVQCVIDLDTVMPGYVAYDFGDAIRTIINKAPEDEKDLSKIVLNTNLYRAYTQGYLKEAIDFLTPEEVASLTEGALLIPYIQTVRFLTDYIQGDTYYKIHFPEHNLQRTLAQQELYRQLETRQDELNTILTEVYQSIKQGA